jgi:hypothetical protein
MFKPIVRDLYLVTIYELLLEDTVVISYTITPSWNLKSSKGIKETSG